jgi:tetratricopeptide (TPR) repeat protein
MKKKNTKLFIIIPTLSIVAFVALGYFFMKEDGLSNIENPQTCDEDAAHAKAMKEVNANACDCIQDEQYKKDCKNNVLDLELYFQAIGQLDQSVCAEINDESKRDACLSVVVSGKENMEKTLDLDVSNDFIADYELLVKNDPTSIDNLLNLSMLYVEEGLKERYRGNNDSVYAKKAIEVIEKAKEVDENNEEVHIIEKYIYEMFQE